MATPVVPSLAHGGVPGADDRVAQGLPPGVGQQCGRAGTVLARQIRSSAAQTTGPPSFARVRSDVSREVLPRPRQLDANLIRQAPPEQRVQ